ncbi:YdeI/OmpD-associated family protein [Jannaschia sp. R86511]|uniref:YdeI/OmpD-associated family protein n=1 Tax=Jannaschia sp. R86511 TaxID=3093853 RepID=UPI0036D39BF6
MRTSFRTVILGFGNNTGIEVPEASLRELGAGKRPPVLVTVAGYDYRSTVGAMNGRSLVSLSKAHRDAAGLAAGDTVDVTLVLDEGPREVQVPAPLSAALDREGLSDRFAALSYSRRKELARQVAEAKTDSTRERRIGKVLELLSPTSG